MTWPAFFLACFVLGFVLSVVSFVFGAAGLHLHLHLPFAHHPPVHIAHAPGHAGRGGALAPVNAATTMAFLAWFGGTGFLLTGRFGWIAVPALAASLAAGAAGASIVFWLMARVLWSPDENLRAEDFQMVGVVGRVTGPIRAHGLGEVIYSRGGGRHACAARSADGGAIDGGAEVVVTAFEDGIASVRRWEDLAANLE